MRNVEIMFKELKEGKNFGHKDAEVGDGWTREKRESKKYPGSYGQQF